MFFDIAVDFADMKGNEIVLDLYTRIGSIGLYISKNAKKVISIEVVPEAIIDAKFNSLTNAEFLFGDVKDVLDDSFKKQDILFVNPPRAGIHTDYIDTLVKIAPKKIVYISCNPSTQARDVALIIDT